MAGYQVHDQTARSNTAPAGEMDLLIYTGHNQPWAVLEGLSTGNLRQWNDHLERILTQCGATGAPLAFLISYAECDVEKYEQMWDQYNAHLRVYKPGYARPLGDFREMERFSQLIRAVQCTYDIGGEAVLLTHFFVQMGDKTLRSQNQIYQLETELKRRMSELTEVSSKLSEERQAREKVVHEFMDARDRLEWAEQQLQRYREENEALRHHNDVIRHEANELNEQRNYLQADTAVMDSKLAQLSETLRHTQIELEQVSSERKALEDRIQQYWKDAETARKAERNANQVALKQAMESSEMSAQLEKLAQEKQAAVDGERMAWEKYRAGELLAAEQNADMEKLRREVETLQAQLAAELAKNAAPALPESEEPDCDGAPTEYRVIIMGDSEAGKSQILHRLKRPDGDPKAFPGDVTPGIDIVSRCYTIGERMVRVNFWDFGGQEILHSMHRMFMARDTMYVIVLNTRNDNQDEQARFWLRYVQVYAAGAPVMLVMNKVDQNDNARLNMPALRREFSDRTNILEVVRLSARDWPQAQFQKVFTDRLLIHIEAQLNSVDVFTEQEQRIRDRIRAAKEKCRVINMDDFRDICYGEGLTNLDEQKELAKRFNVSGVFVYFGTLVDMLLDPQWITGAVYRILRRRKELGANGIIDRDTIEKILVDGSDRAYRYAQVQSVLEIMRKFGLSFQYQKQVPGIEGSRDREFIPMLCPREEPREITNLIDKEEAIQMQIVFTYLPAGLIYQMISKFVGDGYQLNTENVWLYGADLRSSDGCRAVVRRERNRLFLYVQGENRVLARSHMDAMVNWIREQAVNPAFTTRIMEELIGYPVNGKQEFFDYQRLTLAKEKNLSYVISKERKDAVAVQDILDQIDRSAERPVQELLRLTMQGCEELQMNQTYWFQAAGDKTPKMDENARNRLLRLVLSQSFFVKDQPQGGESATGTSPGELDLLIGQDKDTPLAILEALNITGDNADSRKRWAEHLLRMMERYNKNGLRNLVLVSYLNCPEKQFEDVAGVYFGLLKQTESEPYNGIPRKCDSVLCSRCPERIQVVRADYAGGAGEVSVYHFLVHIPQYSVKAADKK